MRRRDFIRLSAAGWLFLGIEGCVKSPASNGWVDVKWDRDTCTRCRMVISDRRFAAEVRGGPQNDVFKFDDIGCAVFWLAHQQFNEETARVEFWINDYENPGQWLDARQAHYVAGKKSPMGYHYAALAEPEAGVVDYPEMKKRIIALGK